MRHELYQVNTFTKELFKGNPACVIPLTDWYADEVLQKIARENAVPVTAFYILRRKEVLIRWFTPEVEIDLCGHATLATAYVLKEIGISESPICFSSISGALHVTCINDLFTLDFPARIAMASTLPLPIKHAISIQPKEVYKSRDYMLVYEREEDVRDLKIKRSIFDQINLDPGGVIVTAPGKKSDFVTRFFVPQASILEDPVTGSAHCSLIPFWSKILGKRELLSLQLSERKGELLCSFRNDRVLISGNAIMYLKGTIWIS